jgi:DNA-directed RNA polymerase subunit RPC12/RpoP
MNYFCRVCNKNYASYKSLWFHNYKYHKTQNVNVVNDNTIDAVNDASLNKNEETVKYLCKKCNKEFKFRQGRWAHEKICQSIILENNNKIE